MTTPGGFDANEFRTSAYLKKDELRQRGPLRLRIQAVEKGEGLKGKNGQPPRPVLELVFVDDRRLSLRARQETSTRCRRVVVGRIV